MSPSRTPVPGYTDVTVERDVECRLRDGVVLRADVYRPAAEVSPQAVFHDPVRPSRLLLPVDGTSP